MAKAGGGKMVAVRADVGKPEEVKALFAETKKAFGGRLDFLFNNAGFGAPAGADGGHCPSRRGNPWWTSILHGSFLCAQEAIQIMKEQKPKGGRIVNNGSISAHTPRPNSVAYTATKHAITGLTKCIALDGRKLRHRLRPARHRQRRHGHGRTHEGRRAAGQRRDQARSR